MVKSRMLLALLPTVLAAQTPPGSVTDGAFAGRCATIVRTAAPTFQGSVLVSRGGKVVFANGYGFADRAALPMGPQHLFDLGGLSQVVTRLLVLRLEQQQKLRASDVVAKYVVTWPSTKPLTIAALLGHRSGLAPLLAVPPDSTPDTVVQTLAGSLAEPAIAAPRHAAADALLLLLVAEAASKKRMERLLPELLGAPFGADTLAVCGSKIDAARATVRIGDGGGKTPVDRQPLRLEDRGARGVLASVLDLHALTSALAAGRIAPLAAVAPILTPVVGVDCQQVALPLAGRDWVVLGGDTIGYRALWAFDLAAGDWVIALAASGSPLEPLVFGLLQELPPPMRALDLAAAPPPFPAAERARFVGCYALPRGGGQFTVRAQQEGLVLFGAGLQASARIAAGRWSTTDAPVLRRIEENGLGVLQRLIDGSAVNAEFVDAAAKAKAHDLVRGLGPDVRPHYVGTDLGPPARTWFELRGASTATVLAVWENAQRLRSLAKVDAVPPFQVPLQFVRADVATAVGRPLVISIEGLPGARRLVFEDGTPDPQGLLDCVEVAGPR
jgi:CubicO group peptidase (beta-lactamase class C family)